MKFVIIGIFTVLLFGSVVFVAMWKKQPMNYVSHAKFFEVYHLARVGEREAIPSDEIRSTNFIRVVANRIGAERILGVNASEADEKEAAKLILDNLELTPVNSEIWKVEFRHRDPEVCKQVLEDILASYYRPYFKDGIGPSMTIIEAPTEPKRMP